MTALRKSEHFVWSVRDSVGQGATGNVFRCRNLETGELFAAKVFNRLAERRSYEIRNREIEVLRKLEHPNIVKLVGFEQEHGSNVLIMELCETSLHEILEQPENSYGLDEQDFKDVIRDVSSGMKYLRDNNIVHRDVKPGNILRTEKDWTNAAGDETGKYIYKITDFGAARELDEADQAFVSIYGTEEYLHPDVYEKAVMKKASSKTFSAQIDLWSIGVTFYHLATGELPFRPRQGRNDKTTMYRMLSEKQHGNISCYQSPTTQQLVYSAKLPDKTRISQGLKTLITPILKGLLETDAELIIVHDEFFTKIENLLSMKVHHLFSTRTSTMHSIYLRDVENFANLQDAIASQLGISVAEQELFYNGKQFDPDLTAPCIGYPKMTLENPLILVTSGDVSQNNPPDTKPTSLPLSLQQTQRLDIEDDANIAKIYANVSCSLKREAEMFSIVCRAIYQAHEAFESVLENLFERVRDFVRHIRIQASDKYTFLLNYKTILSRQDNEDDSTNGTCDLRESLQGDRDQYDSVMGKASEIEVLVAQVLNSKCLKEKWNSENDFLKTKPWLSCIESNVQKIMRINQQFFRDRYENKKSNYDELVHRNGKKVLQNCHDQIISQLSSLTDHRNKLHNLLLDWLRDAMQRRDGVITLKDELTEIYSAYEQHVFEQRSQLDSQKEELGLSKSKNIYWQTIDINLNDVCKIGEDLVKLVLEQKSQLKQMESLYSE